MKQLINCGTCGYPLTPEERAGLVEVDGVMVKPAQQEHLPPEWYRQWILNNYSDYWTMKMLCDVMVEAAHNTKEKNT